jgi:hypothetical protein
MARHHPDPATQGPIEMRFAKPLATAGALIASAILGGTLIGGVLAAPRTSSDQASGTPQVPHLLGAPEGEYCQVFLDTFASELGVSREDLHSAGKAAAMAAIDAAAADGALDAGRAAQLKERIEQLDEAGCGMFGAFRHGFVHGSGHGFVRGFVHGDVLEAAASALGLESSDVIETMGQGTSLSELAEQQGTSYDDVKAAALSALDADLDAAVDRGLDQERADAIHDAVQSWLDNGGEPPVLLHERPRRFGWHFGGGPFAPGPFVPNDGSEDSGVSVGS